MAVFDIYVTLDKKKYVVRGITNQRLAIAEANALVKSKLGWERKLISIPVIWYMENDQTGESVKVERVK